MLEIFSHVRAKVRLTLRRRNGEVETDEVSNIVTSAGLDQIHAFAYGTAVRANGLNYIALSNNAAAPAPSDVVLAGEFTGLGLDRHIGSVTHVAGTSVTTVEYTFVYGGASQGIQKAALFDVAGPPPAGVMAHEVQFTTRTLFLGDTLTVQYSITLS